MISSISLIKLIALLLKHMFQISILKMSKMFLYNWALFSCCLSLRALIWNFCNRSALRSGEHMFFCFSLRGVWVLINYSNIHLQNRLVINYVLWIKVSLIYFAYIHLLDEKVTWLKDYWTASLTMAEVIVIYIQIPHTHSVCTCPWTEHRWFHETRCSAAAFTRGLGIESDNAAQQMTMMDVGIH